jgi:hypothetical protein
VAAHARTLSHTFRDNRHRRPPRRPRRSDIRRPNDVLPHLGVDTIDIQSLQHLIAGDQEVSDDLSLLGEIERNGV